MSLPQVRQMQGSTVSCNIARLVMISCEVMPRILQAFVLRQCLHFSMPIIPSGMTQYLISVWVVRTEPIWPEGQRSVPKKFGIGMWNEGRLVRGFGGNLYLKESKKIARCYKKLHPDKLFVGVRGCRLKKNGELYGWKVGRNVCLKTACARIVTFQNCSGTQNEEGNLGFKIKSVFHSVGSSAVLALDYHHIDVMRGTLWRCLVPEPNFVMTSYEIADDFWQFRTVHCWE